jgi:hypothetical protein
MRGVLLAGALCIGACWTGADPQAAEPSAPPTTAGEPIKLRVKLERTMCFGTCPAYTVAIDGAGRVEWNGTAHVVAMGRRTGRVTRRELEELSKRLDRAQFFDRNEYGEFPQEMECTTTGTSTSCSFGTSVTICSDTSHTILSVSRESRVHKIDNDHCKDTPELDELEDYIDRIAHTRAWIEP